MGLAKLYLGLKILRTRWATLLHMNYLVPTHAENNKHCTIISQDLRKELYNESLVKNNDVDARAELLHSHGLQLYI